MPTDKTSLCLFGASPNTGNQGVNALCWSALQGIGVRSDAALHVFRYGDGPKRDFVPGSTPTLFFDFEGMAGGRRFWRKNHLWRARMSARARLTQNPIVQVVKNSGAVLDVSGGDSFTDMYGAGRFKDIIAPKKLAIKLRRRLILLPQTYGPFASRHNESTARNLIDGATLAYARDSDSYEMLRNILGKQFDPTRHREGVDLAFGLQAEKPKKLEPGLERILSAKDVKPLVGINVSGLLSSRPGAARVRFGLSCDYQEVLARVATALLSTSDADILLVPHVHAPVGHYESDLDACWALIGAIPERYQAAAKERLTVLTRPHNASQLKWIISQTDWFCGTRMHSTIAAISQGIPACALAYSLKTKGVFDSCGIGDAVADLRQLSTDAAAEKVLWAWSQRARFADILARSTPKVIERSELQMDEIIATLQTAVR
jgi:colanic acid/amylovoran biosynthesis protein